MISLLLLSYYGCIALLFLGPALGIALGQGTAAQAAEEAIGLQPAAAPEIRKNFLLGLALNETAAIINGIIVVMLCLQKTIITPEKMIGNLGILCALGIPSTAIGYMSSFPHAAALQATARQPFLARKILNLIILILSVMQTSSIFGLILALLINSQLSTLTSYTEGVRLLLAGSAFGFGSLGPLIGLGIFATAACAAIGYNRNSYKHILSFTFISQALIETPVLLSLAVTLLILMGTGPETATYALLGATIAIACSTFGPGIASGRTAAAACTAMSQQVANAQAISRTSMLAQTLIDASSIYGLMIALVLLFIAA